MSQTTSAVVIALVLIIPLRVHLLPGVTIPLPELLLAVMTMACAAVAWLDVQLIRAFKSSPAPRPVGAWHACPPTTISGGHHVGS